MNRNDGELFFWICAAGIGLLGMFVYFQIKAFADWAHLNWSSAAYLLLGALVLSAATVVAFFKAWPLGQLFPWFVCGSYPFGLPALNWWSQSNPARLFQLSAYEGGNFDVAWYGNGWWQLAIFVLLVGATYGLNKLQANSY